MPGLGRVLEHATYVVAEAAVLIVLAERARRDEAAAELTRAHQFGPKDGFTSFHTACVHAVLGTDGEVAR